MVCCLDGFDLGILVQQVLSECLQPISRCPLDCLLSVDLVMVPCNIFTVVERMSFVALILLLNGWFHQRPESAPTDQQPSLDDLLGKAWRDTRKATSSESRD